MKLYVLIVLAVWQQPDYLTLLRQGRAESRSGHFASAETLLMGALAKLDLRDETLRANTLVSLGDVYAGEEEYSKAARAYSESLSIYRRLADRSGSALMLHNLGLLYSIQGHDEEALRNLTQALDLLKSAPSADVGLTALVLNGIGIAHFRQGKNKKAEASFNQVLQMVSQAGVPFDTGGTLNNLGAVYVAQRKLKEAEDVLKRALQVREADVGPSHPDLVNTLNALGVVFAETGRFAQAEDQYQRALKILAPYSQDLAPATARVLRALSVTYLRSGRRDEADAILAQAADIACRNLDKEPAMAAIVDDYSAILRNKGKTKEAEELHMQAQRARAAAGLVIRAYTAW